MSISLPTQIFLFFSIINDISALKIIPLKADVILDFDSENEEPYSNNFGLMGFES